MKKEIDAIRAKDIAQGGLTQGQQTQIARNEQRISQVNNFFFFFDQKRRKICTGKQFFT